MVDERRAASKGVAANGGDRFAIYRRFSGILRYETPIAAGCRGSAIAGPVAKPSRERC